MKIKPIVLVVICGVVVTLLSVLYSQDMTVGLGATITGYGLPILWLEKVTIIVPGSPEDYLLYNSGGSLIADIVFWTIISAIVYVAYIYLKKQNKP
ncbi:MAG: hypothetical protein NWF06_00200 [Candidatus Bathyarchaeota archaeon]|nr:hypothetical protein [Candidatus Bathyarchaeum sp.]